MVTKRLLLLGSAAGLAGVGRVIWGAAPSQAAESFAVKHTDVEWKRLLTPEQYIVLRHEGTEIPFTSPLLNENRSGKFACAGCGQDQFLSSTKFESGTGWPSFWAPIENAVTTSRDTSFGMVRDEVHCTNCGSHIGHVFDDGPKPTGLRYCINGVAMTFKPQSVS
jgi:peptide-methionine (R)-S-oxide reductase